MSLMTALASSSGCLSCISLGPGGVILIVGLGLLALGLFTSPFIFCAAMAVRRHRRFAWLDRYNVFRGGPLQRLRGQDLEVHAVVRECSVKDQAWELRVEMDGGEQVRVRERAPDGDGDADGDRKAMGPEHPAWRCQPGQRVAVLGTVQVDHLPDGYRGLRAETVIDAVQVQTPGRVARWRMASLGWAAAGSAWLFLLLCWLAPLLR